MDPKKLEGKVVSNVEIGRDIVFIVFTDGSRISIAHDGDRINVMHCDREAELSLVESWVK